MFIPFQHEFFFFPFKATTAAASPKCMEQNGGASVNAEFAFFNGTKKDFPKNKDKRKEESPRFISSEVG